MRNDRFATGPDVGWSQHVGPFREGGSEASVHPIGWRAVCRTCLAARRQPFWGRSRADRSARASATARTITRAYSGRLRHNELAKLAQCGTHTLDPCWLCCRAGAAIACTLPARQRHGDTGHVAGGMWGNRGRGELCQYPIRVSDDKRYLRAGRDYSSCEDFAVPLRLRARSRRETGPENGRCSGSSPHGKHGASCQLTPSSTATFARDVIGCRRAANRFARATAFAVLRLTTSSKVVGCWTGRSAGSAPLRILST